MVEVVGITFDSKERIQYFSSNKLKLKKNVTVVVETDRGIQFGKVIKESFFQDEKKIESPVKKVIRIATKQDYFSNKKNKKDERFALKKCRELVLKENLNMQVIDCSYTLDRSQLLFRFLAETRVDFRNLAKELAAIYKTRIELRQIGVRDKAKKLGGLGPCGRPLCCSCFMNDFVPVSINMAKNQNISLNQTKINGSCGRLLCCLKYEDENYSKCKECLPKVGTIIETDKGKGKVVSINILEQKYLVEVPDVGIIEMSASCEKC